jgi:hypothetical protein
MALVSQAISVRLDDEANQALRVLEATGMSRSEAIRAALIAVARRLRRSSQLAAEVAALEADDDRDEMLPLPASWSRCVRRGDVYRFLRLPKGMGHEQHGDRLASWCRPTSSFPGRWSSWGTDLAERQVRLLPA